MGINTVAARAVFLDRDGVINRAIVREGKPYPPKGLQQLKILPGVREALGRLKKAGFRIIVLTNQPDVARGTQRRATVEKINAKLKYELPVDEIKVCFHDDVDRCDCRKPKPGLLKKAAHTWNIDLTRSFMVGDRWKDIEAGKRAGCRTVFIDWGYNESLRSKPDHSVRSLAEAADWIVKRSEIKQEEAVREKD
jgi:D-glycero-D-manno-heptose 1,7-bisphosphate phosphatase